MSVDSMKPRPPRNYTPRSQSLAAQARALGVDVSTLFRRRKRALEKGELPPVVLVPPPWELEGCTRLNWYYRQRKARKGTRS
jgi:hypothetical protein